MRNHKLLTAASELLNFLVMFAWTLRNTSSPTIRYRSSLVMQQRKNGTIAIVYWTAPDATSSSVTIAATQPSEEPPADPTTADPYLQLAQ
ncbi:hypothetical protein PI125_g16230 [Phytophthora idaei]|nr:hypothetical protein PI125_g16230 [Phytophthora idaei]